MALTQVDQGLLSSIAQYTGFKNRIINGAMMIDQRNAGASVTPATTGYYSCDRYSPQMTQASKFSVQQQTAVVPNGFAYAQKFTQVSATTVGAGDYFGTEQTIEGFNIADLKWGTANAQAITVSFWVNSSLTGTYCGSIFSVTSNRSYIFTYSISSANTWTYVTATIPGDTSGTYNTNNTEGFRLRFTLTTGSNFQSTAGSWLAGNFATVSGHASWISTNGATFYITGVQLEKGSTATSFDFRPYGTELMLCQRYYYQTNSPQFSVGSTTNGSSVTCALYYPVTMRTNPTATNPFTNALYDSAGPASGRWTFNQPFVTNCNKTGTVSIQVVSNNTDIAQLLFYGATFSAHPTGINNNGLNVTLNAEL